MARHLFRKAEQKPGETVQQFVTRLRMLGRDCDFNTELENNIRDEVIYKCSSESIRHKLLEAGTDLTLDKVLKIAAEMEHVDMQMSQMRLGTTPVTSVAYRVTLHKHSGKTGRNITKSDYTHKNQGSTSPKKHGGHCYRCGRIGHFSRDMNCPARGKTCKKCSGSDHFSVACRTQTTKIKLWIMLSKMMAVRVMTLMIRSQNMHFKFHMSRNMHLEFPLKMTVLEC